MTMISGKDRIIQSARIRITKLSGDLSQKLTRPVNNLLLLLENEME